MTKQETIDEITGGWWSSISRFASISLDRSAGESGPDSDFDFCVVLPDDARQPL